MAHVEKDVPRSEDDRDVAEIQIEEEVAKPVKGKLQKLRDFFKLTKEGSSPVKWPIIGIVFFSLFGSAFTLTFLFPFLPQMVVSLGYSEEEKGYYAGLVASSFYLGRVFGSYFWGWLSDKKGRKPVLLINLALTGLTTFGFGFTKTLWFAVMMRFLTGTVNGVITIAKCILYEISDDTTQAVTMSTVCLAWGTGIILGPTVGGFLANPSDRYPDTFPQEGFFKEYPYFLPCLVSCAITLTAFLVVLLKLPETHLRIVREKAEKEARKTAGEEELHLLEVEAGETKTDGATQNNHSGTSNHSKDITENTNRTRSCSEDEASVFHTVLKPNHHSYPELKIDSKQISSKDSNCMNGNLVRSRSVPVKLEVNGAAPLWSKEELRDKSFNTDCCSLPISSLCSKFSLQNASILQLLRHPDVQKSVGLYTLCSFAVVGYDQIFAVWASTEQRLDGLGFSPAEIGQAIGIVSIPLLVLQLYIFPKLEAKLGAKQTNRWCCFLLMIFITATPLLHLLADRPTPLWIVLILLLVPNDLASTCCFTAVALFMNNSVPPEKAGVVNSIAVTLAASTRALGPLVGGSVFAWSIVQDYGYPLDVNLVFILLGLIWFTATVLNLFIPEKLNKQKKKRREESIGEREKGENEGEDSQGGEGC